MDTKRQFIKSIPTRDGIPLKFFLTRRGKNVLMKLYQCNPESILYPRGTIYKDTQDQKHRTTTVTLQIKLDLVCKKKNIPVSFCHRYFDTTGNTRERNLKSKTAFLYTNRKTVKADMIFGLTTPKQKELYVVELENGKDTQKSVEKCINHGQAILKGSLNEHYQFRQWYRTLWVFEYSSIMMKTIEALQSIPLFQNMQEFFLFKSLDTYCDSVITDWMNISRDTRNLYYID